jgi:chemotaxis protein MotD
VSSVALVQIAGPHAPATAAPQGAGGDNFLQLMETMGQSGEASLFPGGAFDAEEAVAEFAGWALGAGQPGEDLAADPQAPADGLSTDAETTAGTFGDDANESGAIIENTRPSIEVEAARLLMIEASVPQSESTDLPQELPLAPAGQDSDAAVGSAQADEPAVGSPPTELPAGEPAAKPVQAASAGPAAVAASPEIGVLRGPVGGDARIAPSGRGAAQTHELAQSNQLAPAGSANADPAAADEPDLAALRERAQTGLNGPVKDVASQQAKMLPGDRALEDSSARPLQNPPSVNGALFEPVRSLTTTSAAASLTPATATASDRVPINGPAIAVEILSRLREGARRFDIRLDPPELGRVDVRLDVDRHGQVKTLLTVDRSDTLELLQREARGLERALQQAGLKTDEGGLEFSLRSKGHDDAAERRAANSGGAQADDLPDDPAHSAPAAERYHLAARARGGVDIRI